MPTLTELTVRMFALLWAWTAGLILMFAVALMGTLYALADIITPGTPARNFRQGLSKQVRWFGRLHGFAFLGHGNPGWLPPVEYT